MTNASKNLARFVGIDEVTRFVGRQSVPAATAIVVAIAVISATIVAYVVWWLVSTPMPKHVIEVSATVALIVATPIAMYLVEIIHTLEESRRALEGAANQLAHARDEAEYANSCKSRFLASASHELRTPLNAILGFSEIIMNERFGPIGNRRYDSYARDIYQSGTHLLGVINDILDLSKLEAGAISVGAKTEVNLQGLIADCCNTVRLMAVETGVELQFERTPVEIKALASERIVRQILLNLLSNAVKFTPSGGHVRIDVGLNEAGDATVSIADTGVGMTPEEIEVAMQPFGQINSQQRGRYRGTGLGLTLVKAMVESHGGTLTIRSVPKEGTTVSFTLPRGQAAHRVMTKPYAA